MWAKYLQLLEVAPISVKSMTSGSLMGLGDVISQVAFPTTDNGKYDWKRTARLALFGFALSGPIFHGWYIKMEKFFPGQTSTQVIKKVIVDQTVMAPSIISLFFFSTGLMEGKPPQAVYQKWKKEIIPALQGNYVIWPAAVFIGYKFVPIQQRVAYISVVSLFWNVFLSYLANRK